MEQLAHKNKWRFTDAKQQHYLMEIRQWDHGLLLLSAEEGRGLDTRFRRSAHVAILAKVATQHEVQQMIGRGNRARGVCEGTLYLVGTERPMQVTERLRKHGVMALMEQERLLAMMERKHKDQHLMRALEQAKQTGQTVTTLEHLKLAMGETAFNKLIK